MKKNQNSRIFSRKTGLVKTLIVICFAIPYFILGPAQLMGSAINQQNITVTGKIVDENNQSLPGVNVVLKGTTTGTVTNFEGFYQLQVPSNDGVLVFSAIGYNTVEIPVEGRTQIDLTLDVSVESLDEVVVIGYGSTTKRELTGAVSSVKEEGFNKGVVDNPMQLVQGKVAGLSIVKPNGGDPTSGFEVLLRGTSSIQGSSEPLVVIDGIPGGDLNSVMPDDIESIDILKDGSAAAIYGTRGTNGVILITTKKGKAGKMQTEFSSSFFTENILNRLEVLSADEYRQIKEEWANSEERDKTRIAKSMIDYGSDTDWFNTILRKPFSHKEHLSLSGGMENSSYRISFDHVDQEGIMLNSDKREYKARVNLNHSAFDNRLRFRTQMGIASGFHNPVSYEALRQAIKRNPTEPIYNEDGSFFELDQWQYLNPVALLEERINDVEINRYYINLGADLYITKSLKAGVVAGLQNIETLTGYYEPSYSFTQYLAGSGGYASRNTNNSNTKTLEATLSWKKEINNHNMDVIGGYSFQEFIYEEYSASNSNFISDEITYNNLGLGTFLMEGRASMDSYKKASRLIGFFGRLSYHYAGKYFFSASVRREGSSKFGANQRWGTFPAVSAAWDISQEPFMNRLNMFQQLKLRAGYGVTGNQGLDDPYIPLIRYGMQGTFYYNGENKQGYAPVSNPNPNLRWETKHETNVGIDWLTMDSRLGGSVDYYIRDTKDLLEAYDVPTPPNLYGSTWQNVGSMRSSGIEFSINTIPVKSKDFTWNLDIVFDYRKNTVLSLSNEIYSFEYRNIGDVGAPGISAWTHRLEEGEPLGNIHTYRFVELDSVGEWVFEDINQDEKITTEDRIVVGNGIPDFFAGLTNAFRYKNLDLTFTLRGMFGQQVINAKRIWHDNRSFLPVNVFKTAVNQELWDDPEFSSYYVENADFVKVDNITLGYTIENIPCISSARIYATVLNAFVFTEYTGLDPEVSISGLEPGNDNRFEYPSTRTFLIGFNVKF
ncbi:MAG: TonB-dependent receptor [Prolixibacteraceae bacterium]|nr:TonB-dependent receptor [Prolixibacteraceae bacterium]